MPDLTLVVTWLAAILAAYVLLFWIGAWWARRTPSDIDDVVVGVLQRPVVVALCLLAINSLTGHSELSAGARAVIQRAAHLLLIGTITWGVWRLVRDTILYYGRQLAKRTESNFDDVLIPVLDVLAPVVVIGTGAILMLRLLGADISTVVLTAGGAALIVGLALKDTLGNILGGLMLLIDTPFRFGDLVVWDGVVCEIKNIGLRVTTLYNTEEHADIFVPNTTLASGKPINLTRPSPDLRVPIDILVPNESQIPLARQVLCELAEANPYVLGDLPSKLAAMKRALAQCDPASPQGRELRWGIAALTRERQVDRHLAGITALLDRLLAIIRASEKGGLSASELAAISDELAVLDRYDEHLKAAVRLWARARTRDPQLARYPADRERLLLDADARLQAYEVRLARLRQHLKNPSLYEMQRLDDLVVEFRAWLPHMFKLITPAWKHPLFTIAHIKKDDIVVRLYVYVDDIHLERYVRRARVCTELRQAAVARLREASVARNA